MFIQSCFVRKNTKDLREKIKNLGYKLNHGIAWGKYLACFRTPDTNEDVFVASPNWDLENMPNFKNAIDCGENEELFLAIAALRDDTDDKQLFTDSKKFSGFSFNYLPDNINYDSYNKATVEEIIEHFKAE